MVRVPPFRVLAAASLLLAAGHAGTHSGDAQAPAPAAALPFRAEQIASDFGVGYAVTTGDVNGDRLTDVIAISGTDLVWFQAPKFEKRVMLSGATPKDNVCLALEDIDGDGTSRSAPAGSRVIRPAAVRCTGCGRAGPQVSLPGSCFRSPRSQRCTASGGPRWMATSARS